MSPRPRKVTDEELFTAAYTAMTKLGPGELTLAAIGKEAGVTAAVLVQRFGSKRDLLLTLAERFSNGAGEMMTALAARHRSPLAALRDYAECMAGMAETPAALARNLAYLQIDMADPDFRVHLVKQSRATREGLRRMIQAAMDAGELVPGVNAARLARTIESLVGGSLVSWAFYQEGPAARWVLADLDAVLAPYLPSSGSSKKSKNPKKRARVRGSAPAG